MSDEFKCLKDGCSKSVPLVKLATESTLTREVFLCPLCGTKRWRATIWESARELAPPIIGGAALINVAINLFRIMHGDGPDHIDPHDDSFTSNS